MVEISTDVDVEADSLKPPLSDLAQTLRVSFRLAEKFYDSCCPVGLPPSQRLTQVAQRIEGSPTWWVKKLMKIC